MPWAEVSFSEGLGCEPSVDSAPTAACRTGVSYLVGTEVGSVTMAFTPDTCISTTNVCVFVCVYILRYTCICRYIDIYIERETEIGIYVYIYIQGIIV